MRNRTSGAGAGEIAEVRGGRSNDRRSKVCTAKGTRDRRVRLSANTAIQFYDVQDRLGYDRASNAVDWLIAKAKTAIDELRELPPWNPTAADDDGGGDGMYESSNLFPPPIDKSVQFQSFPSANWLHGHSQDLQLSLQSLQDHSQNQNLFTEAAQFSFDSDTNPIGWINSGGGFMLIPPHGGIDSNCGQSLSQREPLQSSYSPLIRARISGNSFGSTSTNNGGDSNQDYHQAVPIYPRSLSGIEYASIAARIQGDQEDHDDDPYRSSSVSAASRH